MPTEVNILWQPLEAALSVVKVRFALQSLFTFLPMKMEQTECSETSAYKIQTPGNHPEENIQLSFAC
jgi:hypothetical protein